MELLVGARLCALNSVSTMKLTWSMAGPILLFLSIMVATGDHKLLGQRTRTNRQSCFCMPEREQACVHQRELQPCRNSAPFLHPQHHSICDCTTVSEIQLPPPKSSPPLFTDPDPACHIIFEFCMICLQQWVLFGAFF